MKYENYKQKIKSLVITREAVKAQMKIADDLRQKEIANGQYLGPAALLYFELQAEYYDLNSKLGKVEDNMKKDNFEAWKYCELHNAYYDMFNNVCGGEN